MHYRQTPSAPTPRLMPGRRALVVGGAALSAAALMAAPALADPEHPSTEEGAPVPPGGAAVQAGEPRTTEIPLADAESIEREGRPARRISEHDANLVGVTWAQGAEVPRVAARGLLRDGSWTEWFEMDQAVDPETGVRADGTEPAFLGDVTEVELIADVQGRDVARDLTAVLIDFPDDAPVYPSEVPSDAEVEQAASSGQTPTGGAGDDAAGGAASNGGDDAAGGAASNGGDDATGGVASDGGGDAASGAASGAAGGAAGTGVVGSLAPTAGGLPVAPSALTPRTSGNPGQPPFITRAQWGAEEGATRSVSAASELDAVVLHHTAGTNNYTAAQAGQQIRGIFSYHVHTLGWADIGYNVLIDRFGQIYEGRKGGLERSIVGAHAYGFNTGTAGISVMGNFQDVEMSWAVRESVAKVAAWKLLGTFRTDPYETHTHTVGITGTRFAKGQTVTLPRFYGHRDVNWTSCPGDAAYAQLDRIREQVQNHIRSGWTLHQSRYAAVGGERALGTVTHIATTQGAYVVTRLTRGIIVSRGTRVVPARSQVAASWQPSWGLPLQDVRTDGDRTIQAFENGVAVRENGRNRFVPTYYRDVPPRHVFFTEIHDLRERGIALGWDDRTYRPLTTTNRDQLITFIYRLKGSPSFTPPRVSPFKDVPTSHVFYREIAWAKHTGVADGWPDGTFRPYQPVLRDQAAAFLYRAAGSPRTGALGSSSFRDVPRGHVFDREIGWLASTGISRGWSDGTFRPYTAITREQMAAFIMRWIDVTQ